MQTICIHFQCTYLHCSYHHTQWSLDGAQFLTAENGITIIVKSRVFLNTLVYAMPMQQ